MERTSWETLIGSRESRDVQLLSLKTETSMSRDDARLRRSKKRLDRGGLETVIIELP